MGREKNTPGAAKRKWLWGLLAIAAGLAILWQGLSLSVELAGTDSLFQEYGTPYRDPGAQAVLHGGLLPEEGLPLNGAAMELTGLPDERRLGNYTLHYRASFLGLHGEADRHVTVVDSVCPEITLISREGQWPEAKAVDNRDGDISRRVKCREEGGVVYYTVSDSSGNPASAQWAVPPELQGSPEIRLEGGEALSIPVGCVFQEPGYSAVDGVDTDLTGAVQVEGEVIWWEPGIYPLTYTVTDGQDRTATAVRSVQVIAQARPDIVMPEGKTVYLTFDDGPGPYTRELLDTLDRYGVKATFFVTGRGYDDLLADIASRGHSIGVHTVTHCYSEIYASPQAYFQDLNEMRQIIREKAGVETTLMRFPGGSSNEVSRGYCPGIMTTLSKAVQDAGFQYFDWNVDSDDAGHAATASEVFKNVTDGIRRNRVSIVLQHDTHHFSVEAVERILKWGQDNGYRFLPLESTSPGCHHSVHN